MHSPSSNDRDYNLATLIRQTRDAIIKARERELKRTGISSIQAALLFTLKEIGDEATPAEISRRLLREPHSVSTLLNRMEKRGLIKKIKDLPRKNMVRVSITEKGQAVYRRTTERAGMHEIMSVLSEKDKRELRLLLEKLRNKALKLASIRYSMGFLEAVPVREYSPIDE